MFNSALILTVIVAAAAPKGQIAFVAGAEQAKQQVCVADVSAGAVTPVGPGNCDGPPVWSPDGAWLAFETRYGAEQAIYVVRADGTGGRRLAHEHPFNQWPRWSPNAKRLAYAGGDGLRHAVIVYDLETGTETAWGGGETNLMRPVWLNGSILGQLEEPGASAAGPSVEELAAGSLLALSFSEGVFGLATSVVEVTNRRAYSLPLTDVGLKDRYFAWQVEPSPKGAKLAYDSNDGGDREIFVLSLDKGVTDISNHRAADMNPVWGPKGKWLAFESLRSGRLGVYRAYVSTARMFPVAVEPDSNNWSPTWSPDGRWLAHVTDRSGAARIRIADPKGQDGRELTDYPRPAFAPAWAPRGPKR